MFDFAEKTANMSAVEILNYYRNLYYMEPQVTERGIVANAINDVLPRMILPPVKVGDTVYYLNTRYHIELYKDRVYEAKVVRIVITSNSIGVVIRIKDESGCCEITTTEDFGKTLFHTRWEAEAALKERSANNG